MSDIEREEEDQGRECTWLDLAMTKAAEDVLKERMRQITTLGYTSAHDDQDRAALSNAAGCYAVFENKTFFETMQNFWPWSPEDWKPKTPRENYKRAAALLIAAMEAIDREEARKQLQAFKDRDGRT